MLAFQGQLDRKEIREETEYLANLVMTESQDVTVCLVRQDLQDLLDFLE